MISWKRFLARCVILGLVLGAIGMGGAWALSLPSGGCRESCVQQCLNDQCNLHIDPALYQTKKMPCESYCERQCEDKCDPPLIEPNNNMVTPNDVVPED